MVNQEILIPAVIGGGAFAIGFAHAGIQKLKYEAYKEGLKDRVVKLSGEYKRKNGITDTYATIEGIVREDVKRQKVLTLEVVTLPSPKTLKKYEDEYRAEYNQRMEKWRENYKNFKKYIRENRMPALSQQYISMGYTDGYGGAGGGGYYPREPQKPEYSFNPDDYYGEELQVDKKDTSLMPKNFDYISGSVIKELKEAKGGEKKMKRMPKIFRYALYLAFVVLVWHVVIQIDGISGFIVSHIFNIK